MHEIGIAEDLSLIVLEAAADAKLSKVTRVNVIFGEMIRIVPHIFELAFSETVKDSIAEEAELVIEIIPLKMKCYNCRTCFLVKDGYYACPECGSTDPELIEGKELFVKSIEGE
jgi:hydrogenase nickel incorporation protein HypA/HybF